MKPKNIKTLAIFFTFAFLLGAPFLQSLFFSHTNEGTIQIDKLVEADFIKSDKKLVLLFFGYVGCQEVCAPFLRELSTIYESKEFRSVRGDVDVVFVNLTPTAEASQVDSFAKFFNNAFNGVYLSKKELFGVDRNFSMFFSQSIGDKSELNHTDYLYLLRNANGERLLKNIYSTHPLRKEKLINDIISLKAKP